MEEKIYTTSLGAIHYWVNEHQIGRSTLVMLPGLTANHHLFDKQIEALSDAFNLLVWDAPSHGVSRPFTLAYTLEDKARWLYEILQTEHIEHPILVGQSMGGYVSQAFLQFFPGVAAGFISIDSAPLQRRYLTSMELSFMRHCEGVYRYYPWSWLLKQGPWGTATSEYGRSLMRRMMLDYQHAEYAALAGWGYRILAEAISRDLPYQITCPCLLLCGEKDMAGSTRRYNRRWSDIAGLPLIWVPAAGHNSNTDNPDFVNEQIRCFAKSLK